MDAVPLSERLVNACALGLIPLARILVRAGVNFPDFEWALKKLFVHAVPESFGESSDMASDARISEITGIPLEEVSRIQAGETQTNCDVVAHHHPSAASLLHFWHKDPDYLDSGENEPAHLTYDSGDRNFSTLAERYGGGAANGVLLKQLIRSGAVEVDADSKFFPVTKAYLGASTDDALIDALGAHLGFFLSAAEANAMPGYVRGKGKLERVVITAVPRAKVEIIRKLIRERVTTFMEDLDVELSKYESDEVINVRSSDEEIGCGVYEFVGRQ